MSQIVPPPILSLKQEFFIDYLIPDKITFAIDFTSFYLCPFFSLPATSIVVIITILTEILQELLIVILALSWTTSIHSS